MIFNNLGLVDFSPELDLFLWQIVGRTLPNNFGLSTGGNELKVSSPDRLFAMLNISQPCSLRFKPLS